jgi:putative ABC transport system permease protein
MFVVVYDPQTDFTLTPWLKGKLGHGLRLGEVIGGSLVFTPEGEQNIKLYGYFLTLVGNLEATGTGLDQTMFLTSETAHDVARISVSRAEKPLVIPAQSISAVLIQVAPGANPGEVAQRIAREVPGVSAIEGAGLFRDYREQISALSALMAPVLATTLALAMIAIALVFSLAANERRREVGVLRALGASRGFVLQSLLAEAGILALAGGVAGIALAGPGTMLFRHFIIMSLGMPFALPSAGSLVARIGEGLLLALASVTLAALFPALRSSRQDPAVAMRE